MKKILLIGIFVGICLIGVLFFNVKVRENENLSSVSGNEYEVYGEKLGDITYPQISNLEDQELEDKINENLSNVFEEDLDCAKIQYYSDAPEILFQNEDYLSVKTVLYYFNPNIGSGKTLSFPIYQTISLKTGELLQLDDFLEVSDELAQFLLDSPVAIRAVKHENGDVIWDESLDIETRAYIKENISVEEMRVYLDEANMYYDAEKYSVKCAFYLSEGEINIVQDTGVVDIPIYFKIRLEVDDIEEFLRVPKW